MLAGSGIARCEGWLQHQKCQQCKLLGLSNLSRSAVSGGQQARLTCCLLHPKAKTSTVQSNSVLEMLSSLLMRREGKVDAWLQMDIMCSGTNLKLKSIPFFLGKMTFVPCAVPGRSMARSLPA